MFSETRFETRIETIYTQTKFKTKDFTRRGFAMVNNLAKYNNYMLIFELFATLSIHKLSVLWLAFIKGQW